MDSSKRKTLDMVGTLHPNIKSKIVNETAKLQTFLELVQRYKHKVFFVVSQEGKFLGTVSEGDFRRYLITHGHLPNTVEQFVNKNPEVFVQDQLVNETDNSIYSYTRGHVPVVDKYSNFIGQYPLNEEIFEASESNWQITAIAPSRVSFAGGGSDVNYWFDHELGCVVNLAINRFARVTITRNFSPRCRITSINTGEVLELNLDEIESYSGSTLFIIVSCLKECKVTDGVDVDINCDFGPGTGLGGSSSLVIATVSCLAKLFNYNFTRRQLVNFCYNIERNIVGIEGGWQDQIAAVYGGLCISYFNNGDFSTHKIELSQSYNDLLSSSLFLTPVGGQRQSSDIHELQRAVSTSISYKNKMNSIVEIAKKCADLIGQEKLQNFGKLLHEGWMLKRSLGAFISSPQIDDLYSKLMEFGADGGRLIGAGQNGYILIYVPPHKQSNFLENCSNDSLNVERVTIDNLGVRVI